MSRPVRAGIAGGLALATTLTACGSPSAGILVSADCTSQVRVGTTVYTAYSITRRPGTRYAAADRAECHDVGRDPAGSTFPSDPVQVPVLRFPGSDPGEVIGVRIGRRQTSVFIADDVAPARRDELLTAIRKP